jgi:DnaK suppressor protein
MPDYKKILNKRLKELEDKLESYKESAKPVDLNEPTGRLTRMDAIQQQQMVLNAKKQTELDIQLTKQAMKRLADDEYGICLRCEEEISEKRLLAKPEAPFCTNCLE